MHRRELFGRMGRLFETQKSSYIRPPYYEDRQSFYAHCQVCDGACATACEEGIIEILADKTPSIEFGKSGCTYCDKCALACGFGVLKLEYKALIHIELSINTQSCMSWSQTMCFACKEPCLEDAIIFEGLFRPTINQARCTHCGFCLSRCPTNAIELKPRLRI